MFLSKSEIIEAYHAKKVVIDPLDPEQLNPNSYDVRLGPILKRIKGGMDMKLEMAQAQIERIEIPAKGHLLSPGSFYLGCTFERAVFLAVKGGAKTLKQVIEAAKAMLGALGNDVLSIQMNLMDAVNTGRVIQRADGFSVV